VVFLGLPSLTLGNLKYAKTAPFKVFTPHYLYPFSNPIQPHTNRKTRALSNNLESNKHNLTDSDVALGFSLRRQGFNPRPTYVRFFGGVRVRGKQ
jgi:hypothetical protein